MPSDIDSPASKAFAINLAKYAYSPSSPTHPLRPSRIPRPTPSPLRPTKREAISEPEPDSDSELSSESSSDFEVYRATPSKRPVARSDKVLKGDKAGKVKDPKNAKNGKKPRPFAAPEVYAHLRPVGDLLKSDLDGVSPPPLPLCTPTPTIRILL